MRTNAAHKTRALFAWLIVLGAWFIAVDLATASEVAERIEWQKVPIEVAHQVGHERRIQFPVPIKVGVPTSVTPKLRAQSVSDTLYLTANAAFEPTRLVVQTREEGRTYLLDVTATEEAVTSEALLVSDPTLTPLAAPAESVTTAHPASTIDTVTLTRFAAQQLYAPTRLLEALSGIVREPVDSKSVPLLHNVPVTAQPLIAWRDGGLHVTAVKLTNTTPTPILLDPRTLRGAWTTATFQHHRLLAKGDEADTTVVYLVSIHPFTGALATP